MTYDDFYQNVLAYIQNDSRYTVETISSRTPEESAEQPAAECPELCVSISFPSNSRFTIIHVPELYEEMKHCPPNVIQSNLHRLMPSCARTGAPLTSDDCLRLLPKPDKPLFRHLRALRASLAQAEGVTPYIIFTNRALLEMCEKKPSNMEELQCCRGVGRKNSAKYGTQFLDVIAASV